MSKNLSEKTKVWCDGCYDLVHFGHANSLRQAKALGDHLIVGVHTDEEIAQHKGPPVFTLDERCQMIAAIRWVDEVVVGSPYITTLATLDQYSCAFCCHGDDITVTNTGLDTYHQIKAAGRYKEVTRTPGISTTALVDRILSIKRHHTKSPWTGESNFFLTTGKILQFSEGKPPKCGDKIVYVAGDFDLFHVGHLRFLEEASKLGDYLIVGLYSDAVVEQLGRSAIMTFNERLLSLLACKYVSDVVIDPPLVVARDLMEQFRIDLVAGWCLGEKTRCFYQYPIQVGKFVEIDKGSDITTEKIIERIVKNKLEYIERNEKKEKKEIDLINEMEKKQEWEQTS